MRVEGGFINSHGYMEILGFIVFVLICIGLYNAQGANVNLVIEINMFTTCYFNFGIFFNEIYEDAVGNIEQMTIGLVFININFFYYKDKQV